jgi:hypothetical protein
MLAADRAGACAAASITDGVADAKPGDWLIACGAGFRPLGDGLLAGSPFNDGLSDEEKADDA